MATIKYSILDEWLAKQERLKVPKLYLIFGESLLARQAFEKLGAYLTSGTSGLTIDNLDGSNTRVGDIIEEVSTFSFLKSGKIVAVKNIPLFQSGTAAGETSFTVSDHEIFSEFISKGFPDNHFLILTCSGADKRKKIFRAIDENGLVIDCSVPSGNRKADIDEQRKVLNTLAASVLKSASKTIDPKALSRLSELTGFNLDIFSQNLSKLAAYTGERPRITIDDVNKLIVRDKKDPIFNLTNALLDKDHASCFFYLDSLLKEGFHYLQILKSFENQIRKLLLVKTFLQELDRSLQSGFKQMGFNIFKQRVLPHILERDKHTADAFQEEKKKKSAITDLLLAPNPKSPYPVYQVFLKSENFSIYELAQALIFLSDLDYRLKSSAIDAKAQIEIFIIQLCSKGGFSYDTQKYQNRRHHI